ncbi:sensor domain-containing diguanylate cyclase [Shewanella eurypsychrophilus]|uniref:diguanylate cyclase n=1 Tax=Shewanella eurypsychrophilus TaxID=2593656 RepID=A0ABX6VBP6_9GAMM|nr:MULTISPECIES: sensor domain-containing diguanylate cyclase [Shewanella]QFU24122.1 diguanylate cyclase [Shewanella sp. YLB-09]QPG59329.1 sensor domain-containing diguanylate cyclase [Shewanella eurypsychrophilus]
MLTLPPKPYEDNRQRSFSDICPVDSGTVSRADSPDAKPRLEDKFTSPADEFHQFMRQARANVQQDNVDISEAQVMAFSSQDCLAQTIPEQAALSSLPMPSPFATASDDLLFDDCYRSALNLLVQQLMEAVLVVDAMGTIQMISSKAVDLLSAGRGVKSTDILGQCWQEYLKEPQKTRYQQMLDEQLINQCQLEHTPIEASLTLEQGDSLDVEFSISYLGLSTPLFAIVIRDLTKHKAEYRQLYQWASTDCLTKLANRRVFDASLRSQWQACTISSRPISVVIIDIDHFKQFNDKYGHVQGDYCLQKIANVIAHSLPSDDCVAARYGGEEFALILPGFDAKQAQLMAEYIQLEINGLKYTDLGLDESVTVSVSQGIAAEVNGQFRTGTALLCAADTALYRAKADGRNRINLSC